MAALTQVYGQDMLRYKGVLFMDGTPRRMIFQGVHMLMAPTLAGHGARMKSLRARSSLLAAIFPRKRYSKG
jgi:G3E family GTPase